MDEVSKLVLLNRLGLGFFLFLVGGSDCASVIAKDHKPSFGLFLYLRHILFDLLNLLDE